MAAPVTENADQREQRLADVARLYLQGLPQWKIGKELGVGQPQICYDLKIVRQRWLESSLRDFDEAKAQELAKIDRIEAEFWAGWERSQQSRRIRSSKTRASERENMIEDGSREEDQAGDPRFLDGMLKCSHMRCELLGLNAAKKISVLDADGNTYGPFLTEDDRRNRLLAAFLEQGAASGSGQTVM
jgi:hypothetical protein